MKTLKIATLCAVGSLLVASCGQSSSSASLPGVTKGQTDSVSYAVGVSFGGMLKQSSMTGLNYNEIVKGIQAVVNGDSLKIKEQEAGMVIQGYMQKAEEAKGKVKEKEQEEFLAKNKTTEGVQATASGLQYKIENPGNDVRPTEVDTVEVHYKGTLLDGTQFDSSYDRNESVKFPLNGVIKGWTEGIQLLGEGAKAKFWIPFQLGYGARAMGPQLPAYSTLVFEVELIKVLKAKPVAEAPKK